MLEMAGFSRYLHDETDNNDKKSVVKEYYLEQFFCSIKWRDLKTLNSNNEIMHMKLCS